MIIHRYKFLLVIILVLARSMVSLGQDVQKERMSDFLSFLRKMDAAQLELQQGRPNAYKELWSHTSDVTLSGGFGGKVERGWDAVGQRLDWAGQQFSKGTNTIERLVAMSDHKLGYVVQLEHLKFIASDSKMPTTIDYRVTMVFRLENGAWKIVHRHADSQMTKQAPK